MSSLRGNGLKLRPVKEIHRHLKTATGNRQIAENVSWKPPDSVEIQLTDKEINELRTRVETLGIYNPVAPEGTVVVESVGGVKAGTLLNSLAKLSYGEVLDRILYQTILPNILTNPSVRVSLSVGTSPTREVGEHLRQIVTVHADRGSVYRKWTLDTIPYAGKPTDRWIITGPQSTWNNDISFDEKSVTGASESQEFTHTVTLGLNTWTLSDANFSDGADLTDSKGNLTDPPMKFVAGAKFSASAEIEGVYPIFIGSNTGNLDIKLLYSHSVAAAAFDQDFSETMTARHQVAISTEMLTNSHRGTTGTFSNLVFELWNTIENKFGAIVSVTQYFDSTPVESMFKIQGADVPYTIYSTSIMNTVNRPSSRYNLRFL